MVETVHVWCVFSLADEHTLAMTPEQLLRPLTALHRQGTWREACEAGTQASPAGQGRSTERQL